jgi:hypothetical protein
MVKISIYCVLLLLGFIVGGCAAGIVDNEPLPVGDAKDYFWPADISSANYQRDSSGVKQKINLTFQDITGGRVVGDNSGASSQLTYRVTDEGIYLENIGKHSIIPLPEGFRLISGDFIDSVITVPGEMQRVLVTGQESLLGISKKGLMYYSLDAGLTWTASTWNGGKITELIATVGDQSPTLFAGTSEGIYRSTTLGKSWARDNVRLEITALAVSGPYIYFASGKAVFRTPKAGGGADTTRLSSPNLNSNVTNLAVVYGGKQLDTTWVIAGTDGSGLFRLSITEDTNYYWSKSTSPLVNKCRALVAVDTTGLFALGELNGNASLLSSTDQGHNWVKAQNYTFSDASLLSYNQEGRLLVSASSGNTLQMYDLKGSLIRNSTVAVRVNDISAFNGVFAAATDQGIFRSTDNGEEWVNVSGTQLTQSGTIKVPAPGGLLVLKTGESALTPDSGWVAGKCEGMILGKMSTTQINATVLSPLTRLDLTAYGSVEFEDVIPIRYSLAPVNGLSLKIDLLIFYARGKGPVLIRQLIDNTVLEEVYRLAD